MSSPAPNPLQPLLNEMQSLICLMKQLITKLGGSSSNGEVAPIIIKPAKGNTANIFTVNIKTTATLVSMANPRRANISMVNGGAATIFIGPDNTVTDNNGTNPGYPILAGGVIDNDTYVGAFWAVVSAGTIKLGVWEEYE